MTTGPPFGALVISLDFELHWGVRDKKAPDGSYRRNILGVWEAVPKMLDLFREFEVAATWATVGFLFARSREELERFSPAVRPEYADPRLDPYPEPVGAGEGDDPLHYAPSLIRAIGECPGQEIATHTFSHYYCLEPGQGRKSFAADLDSAVRIAADRGVRLRSIVFPRNQHNPAYDDLLVAAGITCYRGNPGAWMYRAASGLEDTRLMRAGRLLDAYAGVAGHHTTSWSEARAKNGLANVAASAFLRPYSHRMRRLEPLRLRRLRRGIRRAATAGEIFHLWWHPHNFGVNLEENISVLRGLLEQFAACRESYGMRSLSMADAAAVADRHFGSGGIHG